MGQRRPVSRIPASTSVPSVGSSLAVVSGSSGTLGSLVVQSLVARGLDVVAVSRSGSCDVDGVAACVAADLASDDSVAAIADALPDGPLAMLVHAVGLPGAPGVMEVDPGMLGVATDLKAGGLLRLLRAVDDRVVDGTRVVAVGGHLGLEPSEHAPLAGVANAALANLVRQLVRPLGVRGASVHLVAPGPFESPRVRRLMESKAAGSGTTVDEQWSAALAAYPGGAMPSASDVAEVIVSLLDLPSHVLTGGMISLDGGIRHGLF